MKKKSSIKFSWYDRVNIINGFYRGTERPVLGTRKIFWFEREYKIQIYSGESMWIKESCLEFQVKTACNCK